MTDLREIERASIRAFVQSAADDGYLSGRVLDYGCGKQPYRDIVEAAGGGYEGFDLSDFPGNVSGKDIGNPLALVTLPHEVAIDAILCTQVVQYVPDVPTLLRSFAHEDAARVHPEMRYLVLTYPTNWPEVEPEDLHRFTKAGMERLLTEAGFEIVRHEARKFVYATAYAGGRDSSSGPIDDAGRAFSLGGGVICRA